ncbi:molybdate ABC transporter substrate-binding protein [Fundidesulfovibrio butyratiphilus]
MKRLATACVLAVFLSLPLAAQAAQLTVSAAASLTGAFTELKGAFEKANPGVTVNTNFAASGNLLRQIEAGAPVDVYASADQATMDRASQKGLIDPATRVNFVTNAIVLCRPTARPGVKSLADLVKPDVKKIGIGNPDTVPAGNYSKQALQAAGLWDKVQSKLVFGESVKQVADYLIRGEVDAGFVFATDAQAAKANVTVVEEVKTTTKVSYPVAMVKAAKEKDLAGKFIAFVLGKDGQAILAKYGFGKP